MLIELRRDGSNPAPAEQKQKRRNTEAEAIEAQMRFDKAEQQQDKQACKNDELPSAPSENGGKDQEDVRGREAPG